MVVRGWWLSLGFVLAWSSATRADDVNSLRERLRSGVESSALPAGLGEDSANALIAIFEDESEPRHVRLRALFALTEIEGASARDFFSRLLSRDKAAGAARDPLDPRRSLVVLRRALEGLAHAAPDDGSVTLIAPFVAHRDGRIRAAAARALVHVGSPKAREVARARMPNESSKHVRAQLSLLVAPAP